MPFDTAQIETGTGQPQAVVYAPRGSTDPVADAVEYLSLRGLQALRDASGEVAGRPAQEVHLVSGVDYVEALVEGRIVGVPAHRDQRLLLPRLGLEVDGVTLPGDAIPRRYLEACWEAAELAAQGETFLRVTEDGESQNLRSDGVAGVTAREWHAPGPGAVARFPYIEQLVAPFLTPVQIRRG